MNRGLFGVCTLGFVATTPGCEYIAPLFDLDKDDEPGITTGTFTGTTPDTSSSWIGTWSTGTSTAGFSVDLTWSDTPTTGFGQFDTAAADTASPPTATCSGQLDIEIYDPLGVPSFNFGMVDAGSSVPWTGEDCISAPSLCHPIGRSHTLQSATDCDLASGVAGSTTGFRPAHEPSLTYYLDDGSVGYCWVWGADPAYYAALGCWQL